MSAHASIAAPRPERFELSRIPFVHLGFGLAAVVGLVGSLAFYWLRPDQVRELGFSWLMAFTFVFTIAAGSLFWVLLHHAVDANWSVVVRRLFEQLACLFTPWLLLLFLPMVLLIPHIYHWWHADPVDDVLLQAKQGYLNHFWFSVRVVLYFAFFCTIPVMMRHLSSKQDRTGDWRLTLVMRKASYGCIPFLAIGLTFFAIDFLMALNHHWFSTMWGVYIFAGSALSSLAVVILLANGMRSLGYLKRVFTVEHNHIMGKLLFAFTVFWAYISFSQYMLMYYANISEETIFFLVRNEGSWHYYTLFLIAGHFFFPFLMLLTQPAKRNPKRLCFAAGWILLMHLADVYWIVMPELHADHGHGTAVANHFSPMLSDTLALMAVVGLCGFAFLWALARRDLFPSKDPRLFDSMTLVN